ncbi:hypothetical protein N5079_04175 [Planotetraspora sp. A-T 1434]|uniref:hypothetical protein n=1 Tax=Planotetraspora sp. A-T 1434 TaxID=2979219 RepID=UPI0021C0105E|nr:hypothetical protein [Planotetraspora sp. A-T 1434]MCT9929411.1 hypothetical protein [Planotetraspora sp. A-T 1434]
MGTVPPGTGPLSPEFTGIDPGLMDGFVDQMQHAREMIGEHAESIRRVFAANGIPAASLGPIGEVERWIDERLPDLRRRTQIARNMAKLPTWTPAAASALVPYDEKTILPPAEARRLGRELAAEYTQCHPFDPDLAKKYQKIVDVLAAHVHDSEFTVAFFAELGLRGTLDLPQRLRQALQEGEKSAIDTVSRAFGTAVSAGAATGGFAKISNAMKNRTETIQDRGAVGDLVSGGTFPTEWLAEVVASQALGRKDMAVGSSPRMYDSGDATLGSLLTPYLNALARDPAAARLAISMVTRGSPRVGNKAAELLLFNPALADPRPDLATFLSNLNGRAALDPTSADAFGRLLASASGVYGEKDGHHSDVAARFAFNLMTAAGHVEFAAPARVHLSEIAGGYAAEITEGANLSDDNQLMPSAFEPVASSLPGLKPMFRLSPEDTYRFIKTFADTLDNRRPFDTGMGNLTRQLVDGSVPIMLKTKDSTQLDEVFAALGNVRGLEQASAEKFARAMDDAAEIDRKSQSWGTGTALGLVGVIVPYGIMGATLWTALSTGWSTYDSFKPDSEKNAEKQEKDFDLETLGRRHTMAQLLMDSGFAPKVSPQDYQTASPSSVAITDANGKLRPFPDIAKSGNKGLKALDGWFIANGLGKDPFSLGKSVRMFSDTFNGNNITARKRAEYLT